MMHQVIYNTPIGLKCLVLDGWFMGQVSVVLCGPKGLCCMSLLIENADNTTNGNTIQLLEMYIFVNTRYNHKGLNGWSWSQ